MTIKEQLFCYYYAQLQNHKEAAIKSGFNKAQADVIGIKLLSKDNVKKLIDYIINEDKRENLVQKVIIGLERLAFGSIADGVKLAFAETVDDIKNLSDMDLYNISEIKKVKGGGCEVKFFDRVKALEKILEISQIIANNSDKEDIFEAIKKSAETISKNTDLMSYMKGDRDE